MKEFQAVQEVVHILFQETQINAAHIENHLQELNFKHVFLHIHQLQVVNEQMKAELRGKEHRDVSP